MMENADPKSSSIGDAPIEECMQIPQETYEHIECSSTEPKVGLEFLNEDEAYMFYNEYARRIGFSIKKYSTERRKDGSLRFKSFVCSNQGTRQKHPTHVTKNPRPNYRTNCKARVEFRIDCNNIWKLSRLELQHNHELLSPHKAQMGRSHRRIQPYQRDIIDQMTKSGMKSTQIFNFFQDAATSSQAVGFIRSDSSNYISGQRRERLQVRETQGLLQYLKNRQISDPTFCYAIQMHETGEVANFFWVDGKAIIDYAYFGDVVSLDTTFQTNNYEMPFAPILGINNHKQPILFGAALLYDESADSFIWLFETFLSVMSGKQPATIFTDQSAAMSKAIKQVFPATSHRLCLWHLFMNASTNLSHLIPNTPDLLKDLKSCVYEQSSVAKFESLWEELMNKYALHDNSWIHNLYTIREKWASVYRVDSFCADITTAQRSESMNCQFKKFFKKRLTMWEFLEQYDKAVNYFREKEIYEDFWSRNSSPLEETDNDSMLEEAAARYTRVIYAEFAEQFRKQLTFSCEQGNCDETGQTYKLSSKRSGLSYYILFNSSTLTVDCSCKMFQCAGILCSHALRVLTTNNVMDLPTHYVLKRWTKYAKGGISSNISGPMMDSNGKENIQSLYRRVCQKQYALSTKSMNCRRGLMMLEEAIDNLTTTVEYAILNDKACELNVGEAPDHVDKEPNVTIRPPQL